MDYKHNPHFENRFKHSQGVHDVMQQAGGEVLDVFREIAPRDTGEMVRTSHVTLAWEHDGWVAYVMAPVENKRGTKYAKFVEFGTQSNGRGGRGIRAQYNLLHSLERVFGAL